MRVPHVSGHITTCVTACNVAGSGVGGKEEERKGNKKILLTDIVAHHSDCTLGELHGCLVAPLP